MPLSGVDRQGQIKNIILETNGHCRRCLDDGIEDLDEQYSCISLIDGIDVKLIIMSYKFHGSGFVFIISTPEEVEETRNREDTISSDEVTAYHEAAHVAVILSLDIGIIPQSVTIIGNDSEQGCVNNYINDTHFAETTSDSIFVQAINLAVIFLAGFVATYILTGYYDHFGADDDINKAKKWISKCFPNQLHNDLFYDFILKLTEDRVNTTWPAIEWIAQLLLEKKTITAMDIQEILL